MSSSGIISSWLSPQQEPILLACPLSLCWGTSQGKCDVLFVDRSLLQRLHFICKLMLRSRQEMCCHCCVCIEVLVSMSVCVCVFGQLLSCVLFVYCLCTCCADGVFECMFVFIQYKLVNLSHLEVSH